jgi:hypothetical protein
MGRLNILPIISDLCKLGEHVVLGDPNAIESGETIVDGGRPAFWTYKPVHQQFVPKSEEMAEPMSPAVIPGINL